MLTSRVGIWHLGLSGIQARFICEREIDLSHYHYNDSRNKHWYVLCALDSIWKALWSLPHLQGNHKSERSRLRGSSQASPKASIRSFLPTESPSARAGSPCWWGRRPVPGLWDAAASGWMASLISLVPVSMPGPGAPWPQTRPSEWGSPVWLFLCNWSSIFIGVTVWCFFPFLKSEFFGYSDCSVCHSTSNTFQV